MYDQSLKKVTTESQNCAGWNECLNKIEFCSPTDGCTVDLASSMFGRCWLVRVNPRVTNVSRYIAIIRRLVPSSVHITQIVH